MRTFALLSLLKFGVIAFLTLALLCLAMGLMIGIYQTYKVERAPFQAKFRSGRASAPAGFLKGTVSNALGTSWQGKVFDHSAATGINQFANGQRYPFRTYTAAGLRDHDVQVLRIDYNQPGNPWWLRFIADEITESTPGHYIGKIHLKLPGITFSLGYFELTQP